jgi:glycosyltransferase involved in cell wall biosynthesis
VASELTVRAFLSRQLAAMQERYDLTVVVDTANPRLLQDLGITGTLQRLQIARPLAFWRDVKALWRLLRLMRASRFDLVHSMTPKAGLIAMTAAWCARVPVRVHTFTGQVWATRRGAARAALRLCDRIVAGIATFNLADSPSQREFLIGHGVVGAGKVGVLGRGSVCGVDAGRFHPQPLRRGLLRARLGIPAADLVLLFVGRLTKDKGVLDLAEAFVRLADERPDIRLLVVGPDEQDMEPAMRAICRRHASRLHFVGFTTAPEDLMAISDVLCLPSYREGFGMAIIEAAAVGLPAVASRIYGIVDAVVEGRTGLLHEPANPAALLDQLRRIVCDSTLRRILGEAARSRATQDFSQRRLMACWLELYERLLEGREFADEAAVGSSDYSGRPRLTAEA